MEDAAHRNVVSLLQRSLRRRATTANCGIHELHPVSPQKERRTPNMWGEDGNGVRLIRLK